jgi:hypothetical protein
MQGAAAKMRTKAMGFQEMQAVEKVCCGGTTIIA